MNTTEHTISEDSVWITATPVPLAKTLPFYITEAGFFKASPQYAVSRDGNDGFLIFYTTKNGGIIEQGENIVNLGVGKAAIIDCQSPHYYHAGKNGWEFIWVYINGNGMRSIYNILYPDGICAVNMINRPDMKASLNGLIQKAKKDDVRSCVRLSTEIHALLDGIVDAAFENENIVRTRDFSSDIEAAVEYIRENYARHISLDDIIGNIHISKYHFIRTFKRVMGVAPYQYLIGYRINEAKALLCTTNISIANIADMCGFPDASQFIRHFKNYTGMRPFRYRASFRQD